MKDDVILYQILFFIIIDYSNTVLSDYSFNYKLKISTLTSAKIKENFND